jgi:hypothetical protein
LPCARPGFLLALIALLVLAACGDGEGTGARPGEYAGDPDLAPREVASAYVQAIHERDGRRFCELVAPYISGRYDIVTSDPDSILRDMDGCPDFVSAFIGYIEDAGPPEFQSAKVERIGAVETRGELRGVRARVRVQVIESSVPRTETVDTVIWVARFGGAWRVAKLEEVASLASLRDQEYEGPEYAAPPDIAKEQREFAALVDDSRDRREEREASYGSLGQVADCSGGASLEDPEGDQDWNGAATKSGDPPTCLVGTWWAWTSLLMARPSAHAGGLPERPSPRWRSRTITAPGRPGDASASISHSRSARTAARESHLERTTTGARSPYRRRLARMAAR